MFHFLWLHILRKLPPAKVFSSKNFRDHPLFMAGRGLGNRWGLQFFSKKLEVGMLNMRSGASKFLYRKLGVLYLLGITKNDCYYNDIDKRSEELSGPSDLCSTFRSLAVSFGRTFTLDLKFEFNQSEEVGSLRKPGAFNSHPNHMGSV